MRDELSGGEMPRGQPEGFRGRRRGKEEGKQQPGR